MEQEKDIVADLDARIEYLYDRSQCGKPDHVLLTKARDEIERLRVDNLRLTGELSGMRKELYQARLGQERGSEDNPIKQFLDNVQKTYDL